MIKNDPTIEQNRERQMLRRYPIFMDFWKDADLSIKEIDDARMRLAGLDE